MQIDNLTPELLGEVLGEEYNPRLVEWFQIEEDNYLRTYYDCGRYDSQGRPTGLGIEINIYELQHKCKEWATTKHYSVMSGWYMTHWGGTYAVEVKQGNKILFSQSADSEPKAVFRACQWILDNKEN